MVKIVLTEEQLRMDYLEKLSKNFPENQQMKSEDWRAYRIEYGYPEAGIERSIFLPKNLAPEIIETILNFSQ